MYIETHFSVSSPPQIRSEVVACVSTTKVYPRSRYFLVSYKSISLNFFPIEGLARYCVFIKLRVFKFIQKNSIKRTERFQNKRPVHLKVWFL